MNTNNPNYNQQPGPYPQQGQPYSPPPKKKRKWPWILVGIIAVIVVITVSTSGGEDSKDQPTNADPGNTQVEEEANAAEGTVVYEVTGDSGSASSITYFGEGGNQSQETGASLPWKSEPLSKDETTLKTLTAQNGGSGKITCKIIVDGEVEVENTSSGAYAVVSCNGDLF